MARGRFEDPADEYQVWPAFVDLLAATSLLFVTLVAVFIVYAHRAQAAIEEEARGLRTQRESLVDALRQTEPYRRGLYTVSDDSQFVRITLLADATFDQGSFVLGSLRQVGRAALSEIGEVLMDGEIAPLYRQVRVIGHTDAIPYNTAGFTNWELSAARAAVVARFLVNTIGVDPCRISASGVASYYPQIGGGDQPSQEERLRMDRRIELEIVPARALGYAEGPPCDPIGDRTALRALQ
jgi:flagellar motor protein MotB